MLKAIRLIKKDPKILFPRLISKRKTFFSESKSNPIINEQMDRATKLAAETNLLYLVIKHPKKSLHFLEKEH